MLARSWVPSLFALCCLSYVDSLSSKAERRGTAAQAQHDIEDRSKDHKGIWSSLYALSVACIGYRK